jgi:TonB family protein
MNLSKLKSKSRGILTAMTITTFVVACNDSEQANNSSNPDSTAAAANTANADTAATVRIATKRKGKATVSIKADDATVKMQKDKLGYYNRAEVIPAYPGGQSSLENYITDNIEYPQQAIDNNTEGTVYVQFGVDENGNVSNVSTVGQKVGNGLEEEAIRVVSKMPKWTAGQIKGKNVKTWRTLPIVYKLES